MIRTTIPAGPSYCVDQTARSLRAALEHQPAPVEAPPASARPTAAKPVVVITSARELLRTLPGAGVLALAVLLARPAMLQAAMPAAASGITILASAMDRGTPAIGEWVPPGMISIDFVNERATPARAVRFAFVGDDAKTYTVDDVGTFAQNVPIRHVFRRKHARDDAPLEVVAVSWADGSSWSSGDAPPTPRRQAGEAR